VNVTLSRRSLWNLLIFSSYFLGVRELARATLVLCQRVDLSRERGVR
jgi:hypothetical protein